VSTLMTISAGFAWGGVLSLLHFGGLWLSLTLMPRVARPVLWFYGGLLVRYGVTLGGMWLALQFSPLMVMATCVGFYVMRMIMVPRLGGMKRIEHGNHT